MVMRIGQQSEAAAIETAAAPSHGCSEAQRAATYIVISKPNRKSVAVGVVHCMETLLWVARAPTGVRGDEPHPAAHRRRPMRG
jgi:hypothetical protein